MTDFVAREFIHGNGIYLYLNNENANFTFISHIAISGNKEFKVVRAVRKRIAIYSNTVGAKCCISYNK